LWSNGEESQTITELNAGIYSVIITDALGSSVMSEDIEILEGNPLELVMMEDQDYYSGYDNNDIILKPISLSGGSGSYSYLWSTGETTESISVRPEETTNYTLEVIDANGCSATESITVNVEDVSCGNGRWSRIEKVQVCYRGKSLCVSKFAVPYMLRKGATLGECNADDVIVIQEVKAYPNPTRGAVELNITSSIGTKAFVEVYNFFGRRVLKDQVNLYNGANTYRMNLRNQYTGLYIVVIKGQGFKSLPIKILKY